MAHKRRCIEGDGTTTTSPLLSIDEVCDITSGVERVHGELLSILLVEKNVANREKLRNFIVEIYGAFSKISAAYLCNVKCANSLEQMSTAIEEIRTSIKNNVNIPMQTEPHLTFAAAVKRNETYRKVNLTNGKSFPIKSTERSVICPREAARTSFLTHWLQNWQCKNA